MEMMNYSSTIIGHESDGAAMKNEEADERNQLD